MDLNAYNSSVNNCQSLATVLCVPQHTDFISIYSLIPFLARTNCLTRNQKTTNQTTSIQLTPNGSKENISHSYYLTPIKPSFQHLSIRPLEQTVKFVCSSLNVTNLKNLKAFKMHPQPNKLFQTYLNQLIFRLQVLSTLFKISDNHSTSA